ncbi:hypothetical protein GCM10027269_58990 [Kribbella endophytica]
MSTEPLLGPMETALHESTVEGMEILQILGTAAIVLGILVTVLIAIVPTVVDR